MRGQSVEIQVSIRIAEIYETCQPHFQVALDVPKIYEVTSACSNRRRDRAAQTVSVVEDHFAGHGLTCAYQLDQPSNFAR